MIVKNTKVEGKVLVINSKIIKWVLGKLQRLGIEKNIQLISSRHWEVARIRIVICNRWIIHNTFKLRVLLSKLLWLCSFRRHGRLWLLESSRFLKQQIPPHSFLFELSTKLVDLLASFGYKRITTQFNCLFIRMRGGLFL